MTISVGDKLPEATLRELTDDGPASFTTSEVFGGKKIALFAVPGAFTPTCHAKHVPSYLDNLDALSTKGIDEVVCIAVNDIFVLNEWAKATGGKGKIRFLSDGNAEFTKAAGLELDASGLGLGVRSTRFAMLVDDGTVTWMEVEEAPGTMERTGADMMLKAL